MRPTSDLLTLLVAAAGCLASPSAAAGQGAPPAPAGDRPIHLNLEPLFSVGALDGPDWASFASLDAAVFDPDGRLHLLDATADRVVVVAADGGSGAVVGRTGDGPGEYRSPRGLALLPHGRVAIWDAGKRRFLTWDADGRAGDEIAPDLGWGVPAPPFSQGADGAVLALPVRLVSGRRGALYLTAEGFEPAAGDLPLLRVPVRDGAPTEVVARVPWPEASAADAATLAFAPPVSWGGLGEGRVALATTDRYEIVILGPDGVPQDTLARPVEARPTTRADEDAFRRFVQERYERSLRRAAGTGLRPEPPGGDVDAHPVIPPIRRIATDGRGRIWVDRPDPADPVRPGPVDLVDADGRYVGTVADSDLGLPAAFGPDGLVAFFTRTGLDVPVARVFRLPPGLR